MCGRMNKDYTLCVLIIINDKMFTIRVSSLPLTLFLFSYPHNPLIGSLSFYSSSSIFLARSMASSWSFVVIHRLAPSLSLSEEVCSRCSSGRTLFAAVVFIVSTVCHSIYRQTHLFRIDHKRTIMPYFGLSAEKGRKSLA